MDRPWSPSPGLFESYSKGRDYKLGQNLMYLAYKPGITDDDRAAIIELATEHMTPLIALSAMEFWNRNIVRWMSEDDLLGVAGVAYLDAVRCWRPGNAYPVAYIVISIKRALRGANAERLIRAKKTAIYKKTEDASRALALSARALDDVELSVKIDPSEGVIRGEEIGRVRDAIGKLSERTRDIVCRRHGIGPDNWGETYKAISERHGISREYARAIEKNALNLIARYYLKNEFVA